MPRRREVPKRKIIPDPKFKDKLITKFNNSLMLSGKKSTAENILYGAFDLIQERYKEEPIDVFRKALDNVKPKLEVKSRRVGGATYQVPVEVRPERRVALAMRWLSAYARERGEKTMVERLAAELMDAAQGRGAAVKKKTSKDPLEVYNQALNHLKPMVEVKSRRVGGANYQVPVEVRPVRRVALAMRWLRDAARDRGEKSMDIRLANELAEAAEGKGGAMKKREEVHRMAEANKAFSHYRF